MLQIVCPSGTCWEMLLRSCPHATSNPEQSDTLWTGTRTLRCLGLSEPFLYWLIEVVLLHFKSLKVAFHLPAFNFLLLLSVLSYFPVSPRRSLNAEFSFLPFYFCSRWWSHIPHGSDTWKNFPDSYSFWVSALSLASVLFFLLIKQSHLMPRGFQCSARSFSSRRVPFVTLW